MNALKCGHVLEFKLTVTGRGGHGAMPHNAVDPVVAAAAVIREYGTAARYCGVDLRFERFTAGTTSNIIPESAVVTGFAVACGESQLARFQEELTGVAESTSGAFGCRAALVPLSAEEEGL